MLVSIIIVISLLLDTVIGEPHRWHPLVGFGNIASWVEKKLNKPLNNKHSLAYLYGVLAWGIVIIPIVTMVWIIEHLQTPQPQVEIMIGIICLILALETKSLVQHAKAVSGALNKQDIVLARKKIAMNILSIFIDILSPYNVFLKNLRRLVTI